MSEARLAAEAEALRVREADLAKRLRLLERVPAEGGARRVGPWLRAVALKIAGLPDGGYAAAGQYLSLKKQVACEGDVRHWWGSLPPGEQALLTNLADQVGERQLAEARRFLDERRLMTWISEQNSRKRVAPSPGAVLRQALAFGMHVPATWSSRYRWLRRCVRRWGGRCGRFAQGDDLEPAVLEQKAVTALLPMANLKASTTFA